MDGPSNCIVSSGFHAICCISECTALMSAVERGLRAPEAPPEAVAALVAALPSSTMPAHRTLSGLQLIRLRRIAGDNGGHVPIHGRLFAQWMHHAYPRECPYPHEAGTTNPLTPEDWMKETGQTEAVASESEMMLHVQNDQCASDAPHSPGCSEDMELPWSENEELPLVHPRPTMGAFAPAATVVPWCCEVGLAAAGVVGLALVALEYCGIAQGHKQGVEGPLASVVAQLRAGLARKATLPLSLLALAAYSLDLLRGPALKCAFCMGLVLVAAAQAVSAHASKPQDSAVAELPF
mmetsp:Transcript_53615/g.152786  ORF Transcript_53615/g.152786 Transcript_53615/m.152786 type:complete len:294 (-) Transcript_53615:99-980(-)